MDPAALLAETEWIRGLARALVRDPGAADDAAQDAAIAALRHPPSGERRAWLVRVTTNFLRMRRRSESRRDRRERAAARPESARPDDLVERVETHRLLAALVASLPEPNRTAVILRYYEDLEPAAIAARLGVPAGTVRARVHRGLAQLRERLDERHGSDRDRWLALLVPLAGKGAGAHARSWLTAGTTAAAGVAVVVAGGIAWTLLHGDADEAKATGESADTRARAAHRDRGERLAPRSDDRATDTAPRVVVVRGRVVDARGASVPGARIVATPPCVTPRDAVDVLADPAAFRTIPCADGAFAIDVPDRARLTLRAAADGFASAAITVDGAADRDGVTLLLERATRVEGEVLDALGAPVAGALAAFVVPPPAAAEGLLAASATDAQGRFALDVLGDPGPAVPRAVLVRHPAHAPVFARWFGPGNPLRVVLPRGATFEGRVTDAAGTAVPGAVVLAVPAHDDALASSAAEVTARSDAEGRFRVGPVGAGDRPRVHLVAEAPDGRRAVVREVVGPTSDVAIRFAAPAMVRGRVVTEGAAPPQVALRVHALVEVPGAWPSRGWPGRDAGTFVVTPGPDGAFEAVVPADAASVGFATDDPVWGVALRSRSIRRAGAAPVDVILERRATLAGVVVGADGTPLAGAPVFVEFGGAATALLGAPAATTAADGTFSIGTMLPPKGAVRVAVPRPASWCGSRSASVDVTDTAALATLRIEVRDARVAVTGRVEGPDGTPVEGALVVVSSQMLASGEPVRTDPGGLWRREAVVPGRVGIVVEAAGFGTARAWADVPPTGGELPPIRLAEATRIRGRVTDESGTPVAGAVVECRPEEDDAMAQVLTDSDGRFESGGWAGPAIAMVFVAPGCAVDGAAVRVEPPGGEVTITVRRARRIAGRLVDAEGRGLPGRRIDAVRTDDASGGGQSVTGADGTFAFDGLPEGTYRLHAGGDADLKDVVAGTTDVVWTLAPPRPITGTVVGPEGKPIAGVVVTLVRDDRPGVRASLRTARTVAPIASSSTDASGRFTVDDVRSGTWALWVDHPTLASSVARGVAPGDGGIELRLAAGRTLRGAAQLDDGTAVPGLVQIEPADGFGPSSRAAWTRDDGTFEIAGLPDRVLAVTFTPRVRSLAPVTVIAAAGEDGAIRIVVAGR